jgi:hypothetical protein
MRSVLVSSVSSARGAPALAAALATAIGQSGRPALLVELGETPRRRPTLLASADARELELLVREQVPFEPAARGHACHLLLPAESESLELAAEALEAVPAGAACVIHAPPRLWQAALDHSRLRFDAGLLGAELPDDRALAGLAVRDLHRRRLRARVAGRPLGPLASRRAMAGIGVGGALEQRLARWSAVLLGTASRRTVESVAQTRTATLEDDQTMGFMDKVKKAAESAQAQTSKVGVGASAGQMDLANRAKKLMNHGVDTPAHIDSMESSGKTDTPGGTEHLITLTVSPAGGQPYEVTTNQYIYPSAPFSEGDNVTLKVDPDDPTVVMIFGKA